MFNIQDYLEKFKSIGQKEGQLKTFIIDAIKEVTNISVEDKNITIKDGTVFLNVSPAVKSVVFIKKSLILNKIKDKTKQIVLDIR